MLHMCGVLVKEVLFQVKNDIGRSIVNGRKIDALGFVILKMKFLVDSRWKLPLPIFRQL